MKKQVVWWGSEHLAELQEVIDENKIKRMLLVCGKSYQKVKEILRLETLNVEFVVFSEFTSNPDCESVSKGINCYKENSCEAIIAVGGGSAIDVAKGIKRYVDTSERWREIKLFVIPTTAGSGSEATQFAVIYKDGTKYSIDEKDLLPDYVLLEGRTLESLPDYQKKSTLLDALSHAIESYWSINSNAESKEYAREAIHIIHECKDMYLIGNDASDANDAMLHAANLAGKAINISKTTAGHALSYKLAAVGGIAHGHAAALCVESVWRYMLTHMKDCIDARGEAYLQSTLEEIAVCFGAKTMEEGSDIFHEMLNRMDMLNQMKLSENICEVLVDSVNLERLKNTPIVLDKNDLCEIVKRIVKIAKKQAR